MKPTHNTYSGYRYPAEIISHGVWLCFRFALSYRDVEEILAARGIVVSYEAVRQWCLKFGQQYANRIRHRRGHLGDTWYMDEVFVTINGERHYLWRAVDQDGGHCQLNCGTQKIQLKSGVRSYSCAGMND